MQLGGSADGHTAFIHAHCYRKGYGKLAGGSGGIYVHLRICLGGNVAAGSQACIANIHNGFRNGNAYSQGYKEGCQFFIADIQVADGVGHNADAAHEGGDGTVDKGFCGTDFHVDKIGGLRQSGNQVYE